MIDRLASLASQAVQNRHQAKRDLEQIRAPTSLPLAALYKHAVERPDAPKRQLTFLNPHAPYAGTNTSARLESLKKQYEARTKDFASAMGELSAKTAQGLGAKGAKGKGRGRK